MSRTSKPPLSTRSVREHPKVHVKTQDFFMDKKTFQKKWYYPLLQIVFWASLIIFMYPGIWALLYEDDMPLAGAAWIIILAIVYWLVKRIFYRLMFGDKILSTK